MFTTAAFAADATGGAADSLTALLPPMIAVLAITYFIAIRPQQRKQKELRDMLAVLRRGDTVVTSSGIIGRISKVLNDNEFQLELAEGVRVRMLKAAVVEVRTKGEPVKDSDGASSEEDALGEVIEGTMAADEGRDDASAVKPLPANANKSTARPSFQKSKGRRR